jgi:hypothetical protein
MKIDGECPDLQKTYEDALIIIVGKCRFIQDKIITIDNILPPPFPA